jgi:hypothetical protein
MAATSDHRAHWMRTIAFFLTQFTGWMSQSVRAPSERRTYPDLILACCRCRALNPIQLLERFAVCAASLR